MKKYKNDERPRGLCYDCKIPYKDFDDLIIPDDVWEMINPTYHKEGGLLCPTCIGKRIAELELGNVQAVIPGWNLGQVHKLPSSQKDDSEWDGFCFDRDKFIEDMSKQGYNEEEADKILSAFSSSQGIPLKMNPESLHLKGRGTPKIEIKTGILGTRQICDWEAKIEGIPNVCISEIEIPTLKCDDFDMLYVGVRIRTLTKSDLESFEKISKRVKNIKIPNNRLPLKQ